MSGTSLQDQLLKLGLVKKKATKRRRQHGGDRPKGAAEADAISLAQAYSERSRVEMREKAEAARKKRELEQRRREVNIELKKLIPPAARNEAEAEEARYFQYAGKIRKLFVTAGQQQALNRGELGIVSFKGRHYILDAGVLERVRAIKPEAIAFFAPDLDGAPGDDD